MNVTFLSLVTKLATIAISASKHGGQFLNEFFIYLEDITPSAGYTYIFERMENFQNDCYYHWTKTPFKNLYSMHQEKS